MAQTFANALSKFDTFGPQWVEVVAFVRRVAMLSAAEREGLDAGWDAAQGVEWDAARIAGWAADRDIAWAAGWVATRAAAAGDAAMVLAIRHLIGEHGFTQVHYDLLSGPVRRLGIGLHPDDADISGAAVAAVSSS